MRRLLHGLAFLIVVAILICAGYAALLAYPEPLFAWSTQRGRFWLYSDQPFDGARAQHILAEIDERLARSPLDDHARDRIFVVNTDWRQRIFFDTHYGAGGVNHYPLTRNVFIRNSDIDTDTVFGPSGGPAERPRTFTYFAAHEIGHTLTAEYLGPLRLWNFALPIWVREGSADYIGLAGDIDVATEYARYRAHDPFFAPQSGHYDLYRLLVAYFVKCKGRTLKNVLDMNLALAQAERIMSANSPVTREACRKS